MTREILVAVLLVALVVVSALAARMQERVRCARLCRLEAERQIQAAKDAASPFLVVHSLSSASMAIDLAKSILGSKRDD